RRFIADLTALVHDIDKTQGPAGRNIVAGISWGGLHALMAVEFTSLFDAYFVGMPATNLTRLTEFINCNNSNFEPFSSSALLSSRPGFIQYGTADNRVDYTETQRLIATMPSLSNLTVSEVQGVGHTTTPETLDKISAWLETLR